jgi:hypothetical protein
MASASGERRMLGFMCSNDYVTNPDLTAMIIGGETRHGRRASADIRRRLVILLRTASPRA